MNTSIRGRNRMLLITATAVLATSISTLPAQARPIPGDTPTSATSQTSATSAAMPQFDNPGRYPLERIGSQLVRGDNLTGDDVTAPLTVPERR